MRILVVEDEKKLAELIKQMLEKASYAVDVAYDGEAGFAKAVFEDYDLLLLDWSMPKMEGIEVLKQLRDRGKTCPVLMLTARSEVDDKVVGLNSGADDYLAKPFAMKELLARVRVLLRRQGTVQTDSFTIADLVLDVQKHTVSRGGESIIVSPREFALLEYLARHTGVALQRQDILTHVWDEQTDILSNTVDVHIGTLRKKIDGGRTKKLIKTITGVGYKISEE